MTTANDQLRSIQSRVDELEQTISDRGEQIKARATQLKEEIREELAPLEILRKHPMEAAGVSFVTGLLAGRLMKSAMGPKRHRTPVVHPDVAPAPQTPQTSPLGVAVGALGIELLHAARDLAVTWLKTRAEEKKSKG
jgi:ElaB/YqjD/DUF883 family membrane-anchored ribosome-binding protein